MDIALYIILGAALGAAMTALVMSARAKADTAASEAVTRELRAQLIKSEAETSALRQAHEREARLAAEAAARHQEAERGLAERGALLEAMQAQLSESFRALSHEALTANTGEFMKLADRTLKAYTETGKKELEGKKELIDQSIEGMGKRLIDLQQKFEAMGTGNMERMAEVMHHIKRHVDTTAELKSATDGLRQTLSTARVRGQWGERMAEDIIRLSGLSEGVNYTKQKTLEGASTRPDFTFLLPRGMVINMDVKFPMDHYLHFLNAQSDADRKRHRDEVLRGVKAMLGQVTSKDYINDKSVDYVLMFIPSEQVYGFINESDPALMDEALRKKVVLCSPFTLYAVLAVIRQAVENFNLERTASEIVELLGAFNKQWNMYKEKFGLLGERIEAVRKEYEAVAGTRTNQLEKPLRKIEELRSRTHMQVEERPRLEE